MLHGAGGTGGLPPSPCLHPVCRHVSFFMLICPFLMLPPSFSYAPWRRWDGGSPSMSISPPCLSTRFFFMLICPFLMLPPSFSYAPWRRWDGGSPSMSMSPSCCRHVSFFMLICPFLMLSPSFSYAPWRRWDGGSPSMSMSPSCCRHVSFFMLICPFLMLSPSFSYAPWRRWDGGSPSMSISPSCWSTRFFFYANLSFSYAVPLFFLCSTAHVGRAPLYKTRFFWCYPLCGAGFFYAAFVLFLCSMGHFPSISMSLPPSPCLHPVVDMFVFLCPRVFLLCVRFLLLCHRCFLLICPFLVLSPLLLMLHGAGGTGRGAPFYKTRPFLVLSFMRSWLLFMLRLSFYYAPWGAFHPSPCLCLHLHVSHPVVDFFFSDCEPYLFLCCSCPSCAPWAKGWGRGGHGAH